MPPWHQRPQGGLRGGPPGEAELGCPASPSLRGSTDPAPARGSPGRHWGPALPATLGSDRVTAPSQLGVRSHGQPRRKVLATQGPAGTLLHGLRGRESPGPLGNSPDHRRVCAPTRPTNPPEMGLEDPLGRCPPGLGLSPGSPRHLSWSWGAGVGGWSIGGENTIARCGGILFGFCLLTLRSAVLRLQARWLFYLRTWSQGPRRPGQPRNKPLVLVTNGRADD